ncbi:hypothetical protein BH23THE1_BH23THE1_12310 [soil metagenome]
MINGNDNRGLILYSRTRRSDNDDNATTLTIPKELAKELDIENCKVSMTVLFDYKGSKHLMITKHYREIVLD